MPRCFVFPVIAGLLALPCACAHQEPAVLAQAGGGSAPAAALARTASATLVPLGNSSVTGRLLLTELADGGVKVTGQIHGLGSAGLHGFHVHEHGDCSAADGSSAGGHFNPGGKEHGDPADADSHLGDLGNVQADHAGNATVFVVKKGATLDDSAASWSGRALIVHAKVDDLHSQPAGDAGARVACAVIRLNR